MARTKVKTLSMPGIAKISIPVPPLEEQERIVAILDKFDALVNDLSVGLPAEVDARRKQYEYYRDRLLTFEESGMSEAKAVALRADRRLCREHGRRRVRSGCRRPQRRISPRRELEREFIKLLQSQAYEYLPITTEAAARRQPADAARGAERDHVHRRRVGAVLHERIAGANDGIVEKTVRIQEDHVQLLKRDDGSTKNITLIDKTQHPQQPAPGHQPVRDRPGRGWREARQPLRRDRAGQRPADGARRAQAARRRHPRGVQPDQPLPARQLLGRLWPVRVRAALRDQQRHADEVLLATRPVASTSARPLASKKAKQDVATRSSSRRGGRMPPTGRSRT